MAIGTEFIKRYAMSALGSTTIMSWAKASTPPPALVIIEDPKVRRTLLTLLNVASVMTALAAAASTVVRRRRIEADEGRPPQVSGPAPTPSRKSA